MTYKEFYDKYYQYAKISANEISGGAPVEVILAFWYFETGAGTNNGAKSYNNLAGVNFNRTWKNPLQLKASPSGEYAIYSNLTNFAKDYARVLNLSYYVNVRKAFKTAGYIDDIEQISLSPYSVADYNKASVSKSIEEFRKLMGVSAPTYSIDTSVKTVVENGKSAGLSNQAIAVALAGALILLLK